MHPTSRTLLVVFAMAAVIARATPARAQAGPRVAPPKQGQLKAASRPGAQRGARPTALPAPRAAAPRVVKLPAAGFSFAVAPATGALAAVEPAADTVTLYPRLSTAGAIGAVRAKPGKMPTAVVHKRLGDKGYFLVACTGDDALHLLDDATLAPVRRIALKVRAPHRLAVLADPASPVAFYAYRGNQGPAIGSVNLQTGADSGDIGLLQPFGEVAVSADGVYLYARYPGSQPTQFRAFRMSAARDRPVPLTLVTGRHEDATPYFPDPHAQYVVTRKRVYSADLATEVANFPGLLACFLPDRPVVFALDGDELTALSTNTFRPTKTLVLPEEMALPGPSDENFQPGPSRRTAVAGAAPRARVAQGEQEPVPAPEPQTVEFLNYTIGATTALLADLKNQTVLVCAGDRVAVVPMASLAVAREPSLYAVVKGSTTLNTGRPASVTVVKVDPKVSLTLAEGPQGMKLAGDMLTWTPGPGDVGTPQVRLRLAAGGLERAQPVEFRVRRNAIELPFHPTGVHLSDDGKSAVVFAAGRGEFPPPTQQPPGQPAGDKPGPACRVALLDLEKMTVVADRVLSVKGTVAAVAGSHVFVALEQADALLALSRRDLADVQRLFTAGRVRSLIPVGPNLLFVEMHDAVVQRFALPQMKEIDPPAPGASRRPTYGSQQPPPERLGDGWYYDGVVYDGSMSAARLLVNPMPADSPPIAKTITAPAPQFRWYSGPTDGMPVTAFGATVRSGRVERPAAPGRNLPVPGIHPIGLHDLAVAAALLRPGIEDRERGIVRDRADIVLRELTTAAEVQTIRLLDEPLDQGLRFMHGPTGGVLAAVPGVLAAVVRDRLFVIPTRELDAARFPPPLHFVPRQSALVLDSAKPTVLRHEVRGGRGPFEFSLTTAMPGVKLDAATGAVTIDPAPFLARAAEAVPQHAMQFRPRELAAATTTPQQALEAYRAPTSARFEKLTGRKPVGVLALVPVGVVVRDREQQVAILNYCVFLEMPAAGPLPAAP